MSITDIVGVNARQLGIENAFLLGAIAGNIKNHNKARTILQRYSTTSIIIMEVQLRKRIHQSQSNDETFFISPPSQDGGRTSKPPSEIRT